MKKLGLRAIHPAFQQPGREAPRDPGCAGHGIRIHAEQLAREISSSEGREQAGGMEAATMQFARGNAAHAAGNFVPDGDGGDEILPRRRPEFG